MTRYELEYAIALGYKKLSDFDPKDLRKNFRNEIYTQAVHEGVIPLGASEKTLEMIPTGEWDHLVRMVLANVKERKL